MSINHKANCTHAQTPSARKACRKAARTATPAPVSLQAGNTVQYRKVGQAQLISFVATPGHDAAQGEGWWMVNFITGPKAYRSGPKRIWVSVLNLV